MEILQELNEKQRQAAAHTDGAMLVVAGPGTGKTKVITHRIAHLIRNQQVVPQEILAVTFTNKAAQEMLERLQSKELLDTTQGLEVHTHTFHAFCVRLLREHAEEIGLGVNFAIFDQETQDAVLIECLRELGLSQRDHPLWKARNIISTYKMKLEDPTTNRDEIRLGDGTVINNPVEVDNFLDLIKAYQTKLAYHKGLDFDDLIAKAVEVLEQVPEVQAKYHNDIRFILVDEYHDINAAQYALLKLLSHDSSHNVMVVADEDQSIYSWRGSDSKYIEQFKIHFKPAVVELEEHYRCSEKILQAAGVVIAKNTRQKEGRLKTDNPTGNMIYHYTLYTPTAEADHIITLIQKLVKERRACSYGGIAVFYRTHQLAERLVYRLHKAGIPFQRIGRMNSFQEEHAQGVLSYLNLSQWQLPGDTEKAVNFPQQLIDDLTLVRLKWVAQQKGITLIELLKTIDDYRNHVGPLTRWNVRQFFQQIDDLHERIEGEQIRTIIDKLFNLLSRRRSPYRSEDIREIKQQPEIHGFAAATDILRGVIDRGAPIHLMASYGIDSYCAAYIISSTLERYLNFSIHTELLSPNASMPPIMDQSGVNILIGDFGVLPEHKDTTILLGSATSADANVLQFNESLPTQSHSVTALKLCQQLLDSFEKLNFADMVVYDLETGAGGINTNKAEIVEICSMSVIENELEDYHQRVKPPNRIPKSATDIHTIDNKMVANEPDIETVLPDFLRVIQNRILIGHNIITFDNPVLDRHLRQYWEEGLSNPCYDTLATAQRLYPLERHNLETLADKFDIEHDDMHQAKEDVRVNRLVFKKLIEEDLRRRKVQSLPELLPLVGIGILAAQETGRDLRIGEGTEGGAETFLQAAARYVQIHRRELDWLNADLQPINQQLDWLNTNLQPTERQSVQDFINTLTHMQIEESSEELDWQMKCTRFMDGVSHFERTSGEKHLTGFLDYQKLINNADEVETETDKITLMTLHAAKGQEFPVVFIMGLEEGTFPLQFSNETLEDIEEERRLFYVGITRARERLYLTSVTNRSGDYEQSSSMFVREIPSDLIKHWHRGMKRKR